jgi:hypothetical protein
MGARLPMNVPKPQEPKLLAWPALNERSRWWDALGTGLSGPGGDFGADGRRCVRPTDPRPIDLPCSPRRSLASSDVVSGPFVRAGRCEAQKGASQEARPHSVVLPRKRKSVSLSNHRLPMASMMPIGQMREPGVCPPFG